MGSDPAYDSASSHLGPTLFVMFLAYFISSMFMVVYSMAMDTMMHCYLSDKESNTGQKGMWAAQPEASHLHQLGELVKKNELPEKEKKQDAPSAAE